MSNWPPRFQPLPALNPPTHNYQLNFLKSWFSSCHSPAQDPWVAPHCLQENAKSLVRHSRPSPSWATPSPANPLAQHTEPRFPVMASWPCFLSLACLDFRCHLGTEEHIETAVFLPLDLYPFNKRSEELLLKCPLLIQEPRVQL